MIKVKVDTKDLQNQIKTIATGQIPFATSLAINRTAKKVKANLEHEIIDVFDNPTPYIKKSVAISYSDKANLRARVWLKDEAHKGNPPNKILAAEITGGERRLKRFEKALRAVGAIPNGYFLVLGEKAPKDVYGNVSPGFIVRILSYFRAFPEAGYKANITDEGKKKLAKGNKKAAGASYYVGYAGNGSQLGIWRRNHTSSLYAGPVRPVEPMFILVPTVNYKPIFDFEFVANNTIKKEYDNEFKNAFTYANATAK